LEIRKNGIIYFTTDIDVVVGGMEQHLPSVEILDTIDNLPVKKIAEYAFASSDLLEISLPNSITQIGKGAFQNSENLMKVQFRKPNKIPEKILIINEFAFAGCKNLFEVWAENKTVQLLERCFWGCYNLNRIEFLIDLLMNESFKDCCSIDYVSFANNPIFITKAFYDLSGLKTCFFDGDASVDDDLLKYILNNNIKIQCLDSSNLIDLVYQGMNIEIY
jgi:hypothetical protein